MDWATVAKYRTAGQWQEALAAMTELIQQIETKNPTDKNLAGNYIWRGIIRRQLGQIDEAIADFNTVLAKIPQDHEYAYYFRGNANLAREKYTEAEADHRQYIDIRFRDMREKVNGMPKITRDGSINIRWVPALDPKYASKQDCELSLRDFKGAMDKGHPSPVLHLCRGAALEGLRDFFTAIDGYRVAEKSPDLREAAAFALQRASKAALSVSPQDKALIKPGMEYCVVKTYLGSNQSIEYFDTTSHTLKKSQPRIGFLSKWRLVASEHNTEEGVFYYQRKK